MSRVLLVTTIFPPHIGGPATFIDRLGHTLAGRGHDVTVVCMSDRPSEPADAARPFRVRRVCGKNRIAQELNARAALGVEMLRCRNILVNGLDDAAAQVARALGRAYLLKIVGDVVWEKARNLALTSLSVDEFQTVDPPNEYLKKLARRRDRVLRGARRVLTPSRYLRRMVAGWGVPESWIATVLNGVPLEDYAGYQPARRGDGPLDVAFCGRLTNWKGVETLLLAASGLPGVRVHVMGDGPEFPMLAGLAKQLDAPARFHGRLAPKPLREALSQTHVLALPSLYEGLSHTLLEAGALGLPCVASDCGGNPEVIRPDENGLLVPYGNVERLRAALRSLRDDEDLRSRLARTARETIGRFAFETTVTQIADLLLDGPA